MQSTENLSFEVFPKFVSTKTINNAIACIIPIPIKNSFNKPDFSDEKIKRKLNKTTQSENIITLNLNQPRWCSERKLIP